MVVVTVILFAMNVELALITLLLIVPLLLGLSLWFRSASDRGYLRVRDGIAGVLSDVSESLSGVRVVAGFNRQRHNVLHHRNVVGEYRDANDYTAQINARYGASTEWVGIMEPVFRATLAGHRTVTRVRSVSRAAARHACGSWKVIALIRWQGIRLWLRRVPLVPRPTPSHVHSGG